MDKNVELLLREESEVNRKVQAAIAKKNEQLKSIKREAEIAMKDWRKEKEQEFERLQHEIAALRDEMLGSNLTRSERQHKN